MLNLATAERIYKDLIINLRGEIEAHVNPELYQPGQNGEQYQTGTAAFCRAYGISRTNLVSCLTGKRTLSVGLYQRIAVALGTLAPSSYSPEATLQNLSLVTFLLIDSNGIKDSILITA